MKYSVLITEELTKSHNRFSGHKKLSGKAQYFYITKTTHEKRNKEATFSHPDTGHLLKKKTWLASNSMVKD